MSEWMSCTLGDVVECIQTGPFGSQLHQSDYSVSGIPVVMPQDMAGGRIETANIARVEQLHVNRLKRHKIQEGNIVYSRRGDVGRSAYVEKHQEGWLCGTGCLLVRLDKTKVCPRFIAYYLRQPSQVRWVENNAVGITMLNLNTGILSKAPLNIPRSIDEQRKIANILASLDSKIELNQRLNDNLEAMAQALYDYWFVQFDFPDENGKPYKSSGGKMVWNEQIKREIPDGWRVCPLSEHICSVNTGLNPRRNFTLGKGAIRYITVKNLTVDGSIKFDGCDMVDEKAHAIIHARSDIKVGDILFASIAPLGRCYLIFDTPKTWDINESVFSIRARRTCTTPCYLYMYLRSDEFVQKATASSTGSVFLGIRHKTLLEMRAVLPPINLLESFTKLIEPLLKRRCSLMDNNNDLTIQRDFLLPLLMSGQVQVKPRGELNYHLTAD